MNNGKLAVLFAVVAFVLCAFAGFVSESQHSQDNNDSIPVTLP